MANVTFDDVHKVYPDGTHAVKDMDLEIEDGEFVVLVGPSGCGKTTALRMVAGLEEISGGEVRIGDRVVNNVAPKDRDIAMVFQNYALYPHLSVAENIGFGLKLRKEPKGEIERKVKEAAGILGLEELLERKPRALSGGQRQRVAMGRAIVRDPQAFLMDEPLSNLDAKLRVQMRSEVLRIQKDLGTTTLYVTHDQTEAMTMGDRVAVMRKGLLQQVAPPQTLYDRPVNLFVAGFIGSPAMNMTMGRIEVHNGRRKVVFGNHELALDEYVLEQRPGLKDWEGRDLVLGIRPEDMEDAEIEGDVAADHAIEAEVNLTESMGSEVYVHFTVDSPRVLTEDTRELAADVGAQELEELEAESETSDFVGRFHPLTHASIDDHIRIAVDTRRLHFFDPESGESIFD